MRNVSIIAACAGGLMAASANAQLFVNDSAGASGTNNGWEGFMNVFELPANGGGFVFPSGWGVADLVVEFDDANDKFTFKPNSVNDPDPFWYQGGGGPGQLGNKIMEANLFQTRSGVYQNEEVRFQGEILSNTFTAAHEARIFIRDFAADFSSFNETIIDATPGAFDISLMVADEPGRNVQWGFQVRGENVWITDIDPFGNMMVSTVPTPGAIAAMGLAGAFAARRRR